LGLALLLGGLVFVVRRRLTREDVEPEYIRDMFVHHLREGNHDGLDLEFRPVFRLLDGRVRSLAEIRRIASRHGLFGAYPDTLLTSLVPQDLPLLDRSQKTVRLLEPFLPPVIWLGTLPFAEGARELSPALRDAEAIIQRMDPDFRVYQIPDSAAVEELNVRLDRPYDGIRHVLIGENSPLFRAVHEGRGAGETVGTFRAVQMILDRTTFYTLERSTFLSELAQELNTELSVGDDSGEGHDSPPLGNDVG
jgi:hypothetical protein